jgi:hypothetical protein
MNTRYVFAVVSLVVGPVVMGWVGCGGGGESNSATAADAGSESGSRSGRLLDDAGSPTADATGSPALDGAALADADLATDATHEDAGVCSSHEFVLAVDGNLIAENAKEAGFQCCTTNADCPPQGSQQYGCGTYAHVCEALLH